MARKLKTYRVAYAVTRTEFYDIEARNEKDAEERAFEDGMLVEYKSDTTNVVACWTERRTTPTAGPKRGDQ